MCEWSFRFYRCERVKMFSLIIYLLCQVSPVAMSQVSDSFRLFPGVVSSPYLSLNPSLLTSTHLCTYHTWCGPSLLYIPHIYTTQMGCIASGLALYVPYDFSLHTQLTALESYGLRYTTPLLTLIVAPVAMRIK